MPAGPVSTGKWAFSTPDPAQDPKEVVIRDQTAFLIFSVNLGFFFFSPGSVPASKVR